MKQVELYAKVRYAVQVEGLSERAAARRFGIDPRTVGKMMKFSVPPGYRRSKPPAKPKLDRFIAVIENILADDKRRPKKQQHTAKRIFERLRDEHGFTGCVYRKLRFGRIGGAAHRGAHETQCVRSAESVGLSAHPCSRNGVSASHYSNARMSVGPGASAARPAPQCDQRIRDGSSQPAFRQNNSAGRARRNRLVANAHTPQSSPDNAAIDAITITDQVPWRPVPGECFGYLLRNPFRRRVRRDIDPHKVSPCQPNNDKGSSSDWVDHSSWQRTCRRSTARLQIQA